MDKIAKNRISMQTMIDGIKLAVYFSLATNLYEIYQFVSDPSALRKGISIALGVITTLFLWQFSRELQAGKRQALFYWLAMGLIGYIRWIFVDATFSLHVMSVIVMLVTIVFTLRIVVWVRNKSLT